MTAGVRCRVFEDVSKLRTNRGSSLRSSVPSAVKCLPQRAQRTAEKSSEEQEYSRMTPIYLDYNATTPIDPAVRAAMMPFLEEHFGNPSSTHAYGRVAHEAVEKARGQLAGLLGAQPDEVVFTGGGSEASNHAIKGTVFGQMSGLFTRLLH